MPDPQPNVTFRFAKASDFRLLPVNCVWGGLTPRGDIMVHLCHEKAALPSSVTYAVASNGQLANEINRDPDSVYDRIAMAGIVLTVDQAASIGGWLLERVAEAQAAEKGGDGHGKPTTAH